MKTPIFINNVEIRAIVDTGAATCAISKRLLDETHNEIQNPSNVRCIMANGSKIASLGKSVIEIEIDEIITEIEVEVINSQDRMLIIGNDFMSEWKANIDFETHTLTLNDQDYELCIPVEYIKNNKIRFETPVDDEYTDEEENLEYEKDEEMETFRIEDLEEEYISEDELKH